MNEQLGSTSKYEPGFNPDWIHDEQLNLRAKQRAEFYLKNAEMETASEELGLIHFFGDENLTDQDTLKNNSDFFDCDRSWLQSIGVEVPDLEERFGKNKYIVAIPVKYLKQWTQSLSWLKLCQSGALEQAAVFNLPARELIVRDHKFADKGFDADIIGDSQGNAAALKEYYDSTQKLDQIENLDDFFLPEVWIGEEIDLQNSKLLKFEY